MSKNGENIYKRKDGRFEGRYISSYDENGKARYSSVYGHTREEARQKLRQEKGEAAGEDFYTNRCFSEVAPLWLEERGKSLARTTKDRYASTLELYINPYIGIMKVFINTVKLLQHSPGEDPEGKVQGQKGTGAVRQRGGESCLGT